MNTADFENAIIGLGCSIELDQVVLAKGQVEKCYGHKGNLALRWDELGRAFSFLNLDEHQLRPRQLQFFLDECGQRDTIYDLKFQ